MDSSAAEQERLAREVARWQERGRRPPAIVAPGPGQESVWDFPRPPRLESVPERIAVAFAGRTVAETTRGVRVVETAGAPVYYFPPADVELGCLRPSRRASDCEWKGRAAYWHVTVGDRTAEDAAWSYPAPFPSYAALRDYVAFFAGRMDACHVGTEQVTPQPGEVYGGWVTGSLTGPIKGEPGSELW